MSPFPLFLEDPTRTEWGAVRRTAISPPLLTMTWVMPRSNRKSATPSAMVPATAAMGVRCPLPTSSVLSTILRARGSVGAGDPMSQEARSLSFNRATLSRQSKASSAARRFISRWGTFPTKAEIESRMGPHSAMIDPSARR